MYDIMEMDMVYGGGGGPNMMDDMYAYIMTWYNYKFILYKLMFIRTALWSILVKDI